VGSNPAGRATHNGSIPVRSLPQLFEQRFQNLKSLDLMMIEADLAHLDSLTKPTFGFPQNMQPIFPAIHKGGTMVNGVHALPSAFVLEKTDRPY
jgi:hypothetical protein